MANQIWRDFRSGLNIIYIVYHCQRKPYPVWVCGLCSGLDVRGKTGLRLLFGKIVECATKTDFTVSPPALPLHTKAETALVDVAVAPVLETGVDQAFAVNRIFAITPTIDATHAEAAPEFFLRID